ncbi:thioredoxin-like protein [Phascolomyces articulosus]|uniref:Thioredoxin-like protein n=1 Tax=Phascolomyces articulosus TaxID=60185 RepID=A0AAD5KE64_9FUNG|nr:thioredoxin-like protein [Phascolomyces articulosus]
MSTLPQSIQDIEAKERFASGQRRQGLRFSLRGRVLICVGILMLTTVLLMVHFGDPSKIPSFSFRKSLSNTDMDQGAAVAAMDNDIPLPQQQSLEAELESILRAHPLTVFSKTYCPYSRKAKEILNEYPLRIPYYVVEVDLRPDALDVKRLLGEKTGRDTFPNVFVNGGSIGGATELGRFDRSGRLEEILKENNLL